MRSAIPFALFGLLALAPLADAFMGPGFATTIVTRIMIFAIAALALDLVLGHGGLVSFGHAAFMGIGAYATGILAVHGVTEAAIQLPVAVLAGAAFAGLTGLIVMRTGGVQFIMITLAFAQMAFFVAVSLVAYGGDDGLTLPERSRVFGTALIENRLALYYLTFLLLLGCYALCRAIVASRFGRVLRGARESGTRMEAIGFSPYTYRLVAYVISGAMASVAGFLLANHVEFVSPAYMSWQRSGELIVMVVLGGMGTLHGAILGAAAYLITEDVLGHFTQHWKVVFGPLLILVVLFARGGLFGLLTGKRQ